MPEPQSPDLQAATALAGDLLPNALIFLTGSHMFGLNTPDSDEDYTVIYFDPEDDRRVFRKHPEVLHSKGNDQKLYSLRKYAELLSKGNPNVSEMVNLKAEAVGTLAQPAVSTTSQYMIRELLYDVTPFVATQLLAAAYLGHLQGLMKELAHGKYEASRAAHGFRVAYSALYLLETGKVPDFREMHPQRATALAVKRGEADQEWAELNLRVLEREVSSMYHVYKNDLPTNDPLREAINRFFVEIHA